MNMKEIQALKPEDRVKRLQALREQVRDLRFKIRSKEVKNNHQLKAIKKDIARMLTLHNNPVSGESKK
ncbi:MAG: 50S ribosomal protein L29 [bacterium]|nr:50S ribosomal protein L29 [bacterium]